jgi:hypothetical protein
VSELDLTDRLRLYAILKGGIAVLEPLQSEVATMLGISQGDVKSGTHISKRDRFTFLIATTRDGHDVFIKASANDDLREALKREAYAAMIGKRLDLPMIRAYPFRNGQFYGEHNGVGAVVLEMLPHDQWLFCDDLAADLPNLDTSTVVRMADSCAEIIAQISGQELPSDIDPTPLLHTIGAAPRFRSSDVLNTHLISTCTPPVLRNLANIFVTGVDARGAWLQEQLKHAGRYIDMYDVRPGANEYWMYHGDCSTSNLCLHRDTDASRPFVTFDNEYFSVCRSSPLAVMCDLANLFGRCWANQTLQESFLRAVKAKLMPRRGEMVKQLLHASIMVGTMNLARFAMDTTHHEHPMSVALLTRLPRNLAIISE